MNLILTLTEEQLDQIAERVAAKVGHRANRPLTVAEAAERLGICGATVRRRVMAGEIARVPLTGSRSRVMIPAAEIERLLSLQTA